MSTDPEDIIQLLHYHSFADAQGGDSCLDERLETLFAGVADDDWQELLDAADTSELKRKLMYAAARLAPRTTSVGMFKTLAHQFGESLGEIAVFDKILSVVDPGDEHPFEFITGKLSDSVTRYRLLRDGSPASYKTALRTLRDDRSFRRLFNRALADAPFEAFFWETPPATAESASRPFEFVVCDAPVLTRRPADHSAFAQHFQPDEMFASFANLGRDAILVAPAPAGIDYAHIGHFVRRAPEPVALAFWHRVAHQMLTELGDDPIWLNTSGAGIPWLHVRLDSTPKYYTFDEYR